MQLMIVQCHVNQDLYDSFLYRKSGNVKKKLNSRKHMQIINIYVVQEVVPTKII